MRPARELQRAGRFLFTRRIRQARPPRGEAALLVLSVMLVVDAYVKQ